MCVCVLTLHCIKIYSLHRVRGQYILAGDRKVYIIGGWVWGVCAYSTLYKDIQLTLRGGQYILAGDRKVYIIGGWVWGVCVCAYSTLYKDSLHWVGGQYILAGDRKVYRIGGCVWGVCVCAYSTLYKDIQLTLRGGQYILAWACYVSRNYTDLFCFVSGFFVFVIAVFPLPI